MKYLWLYLGFFLPSYCFVIFRHFCDFSFHFCLHLSFPDLLSSSSFSCRCSLWNFFHRYYQCCLFVRQIFYCCFCCCCCCCCPCPGLVLGLHLHKCGLFVSLWSDENDDNIISEVQRYIISQTSKLSYHWKDRKILNLTHDTTFGRGVWVGGGCTHVFRLNPHLNAFFRFLFFLSYNWKYSTISFPFLRLPMTMNEAPSFLGSSSERQSQFPPFSR